MKASKHQLRGVANGGLSILKSTAEGWRVQWRNDGYDYPSLLEKFQRGELEGRPLSTGSSFRKVWRIELAGRVYVIKHDWEVDHRTEKVLWDFIGGTPYHRLIKFTTRALMAGCRIAQEVYLVAEKMLRGRCREAWLVAEYVEGESFITEYKDGQPSKVMKNLGDFVPAMNEALEALHDCGLASNDIHPGQFILTREGLRIIDLSLDGPMIVCQVNDALTMMHFFNSRPPLRKPLRRVFFKIFSLYRRFKNFYRAQRARP